AEGVPDLRLRLRRAGRDHPELAGHDREPPAGRSERSQSLQQLAPLDAHRAARRRQPARGRRPRPLGRERGERVPRRGRRGRAPVQERTRGAGSRADAAVILAVDVPHELWRAVSFTLGMTWEILWALVLGFLLSAIVQALVPKQQVERLLPDASPKSLATATGLGIASSSCSYASVAIARTLFRKGADFTSAIAFQLASTNLVVELGVVMAIVLGWQFTLGEFVGGPVMIVALALLFRVFLTRRLVDEARAEAERGRLGAMEGHAAMAMTDVSHVYVMEVAAVWRDIAIGLLAAGALAAWVPGSCWRALFLVHHGAAAKVWGP